MDPELITFSPDGEVLLPALDVYTSVKDRQKVLQTFWSTAYSMCHLPVGLKMYLLTSRFVQFLGRGTHLR